jgi:hypothetical protein
LCVYICIYIYIYIYIYMTTNIVCEEDVYEGMWV